MIFSIWHHIKNIKFYAQHIYVTLYNEILLFSIKYLMQWYLLSIFAIFCLIILGIEFIRRLIHTKKTHQYINLLTSVCVLCYIVREYLNDKYFNIKLLKNLLYQYTKWRQKMYKYQHFPIHSNHLTSISKLSYSYQQYILYQL